MSLRPEVIFQNDSLLAVTKPSGLLSIPDRYRHDKPSVASLLIADFPDARPLHRLDLETSGVLLFCLDPDAFGWYSEQFESRSTLKSYLALLEGRVTETDGVIGLPLWTRPDGRVVVTKRGKPALTEWSVVETFRKYSLVEARPKTGRTHQIRVHFASMGHPVACDVTYGAKGPVFVSEIKGKKQYRMSAGQDVERPILTRVALHAAGITILDYATQLPIEITAPMPKDLKATCAVIRKWAATGT